VLVGDGERVAIDAVAGPEVPLEVRGPEIVRLRRDRRDHAGVLIVVPAPAFLPGAGRGSSALGLAASALPAISGPPRPGQETPAAGTTIKHPGVVPAITTQPNDLLTADFKGHFRTRDASIDYPLTIADQHTRYLLACHGLLSTKGHGVRPSSTGCSESMACPRHPHDNGGPFATTGIHGLSQLNVWWLRLGIQHQRILPAQPPAERRARTDAQNPQRDAIRPPRSTLVTQQRAFNAFRRLYNDRAAPRGAPESAAGHALPALAPRPTRVPCPPSSIPGTSSSSASLTRAPSA